MTPSNARTRAPSAARSLFRRGAAVARTIRGYLPLTILGVLVTTISASALSIYAYDERDLVAFLLAGATLAFVALALVLTSVAALVVGLGFRGLGTGRAISTITTDQVDTELLSTS